jgi:hypothetical protein
MLATMLVGAWLWWVRRRPRTPIERHVRRMIAGALADRSWREPYLASMRARQALLPARLDAMRADALSRAYASLAVASGWGRVS